MQDHPCLFTTTHSPPMTIIKEVVFLPFPQLFRLLRSKATTIDTRHGGTLHSPKILLVVAQPLLLPYRTMKSAQATQWTPTLAPPTSRLLPSPILFPIQRPVDLEVAQLEVGVMSLHCHLR